ncbi:hypothetical protein DENSPDRAFT_846201 [Dentipellis sp. KUC8613]|nr:hypothetical protein DENSPDRAFT_846201 [Dentipellis sp. KUC8613]
MLWSSTTATVILLLSCFLVAQAQQHATSPPAPANDTEVICSPFGPCEPCPDDALNEPFCQPFGNRRLMHCSRNHDSTSTSPITHRPPGHRPLPQDTPQGETPAWESCGRIVEQERADYWEFVACNVLFAALALFLVFARSRRLEALQARKLAARIGLLRSGPGGS